MVGTETSSANITSFPLSDDSAEEDIATGIILSGQISEKELRSVARKVRQGRVGPTSVSSAGNEVIPRPPLLPPRFPSPHSIINHTEPRPHRRLRDIRVLCQCIPQLPSLLIVETPRTNSASYEVIPRPALLPLLIEKNGTCTGFNPNLAPIAVNVAYGYSASASHS